MHTERITGYVCIKKTFKPDIFVTKEDKNGGEKKCVWILHKYW